MLNTFAGAVVKFLGVREEEKPCIKQKIIITLDTEGLPLRIQGSFPEQNDETVD